MSPLGPMETVATGLAFPEGPTSLGDGTIACVEMQGGCLTRVHGDGRLDPIAELGGGPNGSALGADGALYVADNGGLSMQIDGSGYWHAEDSFDGRIRRVDNGVVTQVEADLPGPAPHRPERPDHRSRRRAVRDRLGQLGGHRAR